MRFIIVIAFAIGILAGVYWNYFILRTLRFWKKGEVKRWLRITVVAASVFLVLISLNPFGFPALITYHILGISLFLDAVHALICLANRKKQNKLRVWDRIYRCGLAPLLITAVVLVCGYFNMINVKEKTYEVMTDKHLSSSEGYKAAFLSDLHFGNTMQAETLEKYAKEIETHNPDFVILGGDIVDERTTKEGLEQCMRILGGIQCRYGVFYVYGNHDSASYSSAAKYNLDDLNRSLKTNGITCLSDEVYRINDDILLAGRNGRVYSSSDRLQTERLLKDQDKNCFILLADHKPVELQQNAKAGVDLQLSGHTHGGQIWPVGLISDVLGFGEMNYGEKQIENCKVLVSSGIAGWGYTVRTGHNSEYLIVQIKEATGR